MYMNRTDVLNRAFAIVIHTAGVANNVRQYFRMNIVTLILETSEKHAADASVLAQACAALLTLSARSITK